MSSQHDAARLVVVDPAHLRGQQLTLSSGDVVVGRGAGSQLVLDDPHVSRTHAVIRTAGDRAVVEDLGSRGGTTVNGVPAVTATVLRDGDLVSFAGVSVRYESAGSRLAETRIAGPLPRQASAPAGPASGWAPAGRPAPAPGWDPAARAAAAPGGVRYDIGQQHAGVISNVGRDQYNAYVQQRESFLRDVAATKSRARMLAWLGFLLLVVGFVVYGGTILRFIQRISTFDETTDPQDIELLGPEVGGVPIGIAGAALCLLGSVLLIVGIVLHVVAAARRRRVDRDMPPVFPRPPY